MKFNRAKLKEWLQNFDSYPQYREQVIQAKQAMPDRTMHILSEEDFDRLRFGVGMADQENREEHRTLDNKIDAVNSRLDGALGHIYGFEGRPGVLDNIAEQLHGVKDEITKFNTQFHALQIQREQDKAHYEAVNDKLRADVNHILAQAKKQGAGLKKFRDAALGASAVGLVGIVLNWLRNFSSQLAEVMRQMGN